MLQLLIRCGKLLCVIIVCVAMLFHFILLETLYKEKN